MSTFSSFQITSAPTPDELASMQRQAEAPRIAQEARNTGGGKSRITYQGGAQTVQDLSVRQVQMSRVVPSDRIVINGTETTRAAAIAAGVLVDDSGGANADSADPLPAGQPDAPKTGNAADIEDAEREAAPEAVAAVQAAGAAMNDIIATVGPTAANAYLQAGASEGAIPENLPEGVTQAQAEAVIDGYIASAGHTLAGAGSSVPMVQEMLTENELAIARRATVSGDKGLLRNLGQQARTRLEMLPTEAPDRMAQLLEGMSPGDRKMLSQRDGKWVLTTPSGQMSWGTAVRQGLIKF